MPPRTLSESGPPSPSDPISRSGLAPKLGSRWIQYPFTTGILSFSVLIAILTYLSYTQNQRELGTSGCRMSWMNPRYVKLEGARGEGMQGLERKYELWLYREGGIQHGDTPTGQPVLFIPGNAGSYQQVRSIASSAAIQFQRIADQDQKLDWQDLDFFTVNTNEEFSALHGHTLRDQAHYVAHSVRHILSLYPASSGPRKILLLGHSMGGVVARHSITLVHSGYDKLEDDISDKVMAIVMMSTPAVLPPLALDRGMWSVYTGIDDFWQHRSRGIGMIGNVMQKEKRWPPPVLVSICGGTSDTQISSDSCGLPSYPGYYWQPDENSPLTNDIDSGTISVFTTGLQGAWTGVEHQAIVWCDQVRSKIATALLDIGAAMRSSPSNPRLQRESIARICRSSFMGEKTPEQMNGLPAMESFVVDLQQDWAKLSPSRQTFNHRPKTEGVYLVEVPPLYAGDLSFQLSGFLNVRGLTAMPDAPYATLSTCALIKNTLTCQPSKLQRVTILPSATSANGDREWPQAGAGAQLEESVAYAEVLFKGETIDPSLRFILLRLAGPGWGMAGFSGRNSTVGWQPIMQTFTFPDRLDHSLVAYRASPQWSTGCPEIGGQLISPILEYKPASRVPTALSESQFFPHFGGESIRLHSHVGGAAYICDATHSVTTVNIYQDPSAQCRIEDITLAFDWRAIPGLAVVRLRLTLGIWTVGSAAFVFANQLFWFQQSGQWLSEIDAIEQIFRSRFRILGLSFLAALGIPITLRSLDFPFANQLFLGAPNFALELISAPLLVLATGLLLVLSTLLRGFVRVLAALATATGSATTSYRKPEDRRAGCGDLVAIGGGLLLLGLTILALPIQVLSFPIFGWHLMTTVRMKAQEDSRVRYCQSILLMLFLNVVISSPVILVWIRHLMETRGATFGGEHNPLTILPLIYVVGSCARSGSLQQSAPLRVFSASLVFAALGVYAILLGSVWAFGLQYVMSIGCAVLATAIR